MDAYLKKEKVGTLFVLVGALEGGSGGGVPSGFRPETYTCLPKNNNEHPPADMVYTFCLRPHTCHPKKINTLLLHVNLWHSVRFAVRFCKCQPGS